MRGIPPGTERNGARAPGEFSIHLSTLQLEKGDVFVAYTDGITESENHRGELWGQERLETLLRACRDCTPAQIVERIVDEILTFGNECSQKDDMTLVVAAVKHEVGI